MHLGFFCRIYYQNRRKHVEQCRKAFHALNTSPFTLLPLIDSTGGLVFSSDDQEPSSKMQSVAIARQEDIAQQIKQLQYQHGHWCV